MNVVTATAVPQTGGTPGTAAVPSGAAGGFAELVAGLLDSPTPGEQDQETEAGPQEPMADGGTGTEATVERPGPPPPGVPPTPVVPVAAAPIPAPATANGTAPRAVDGTPDAPGRPTVLPGPAPAGPQALEPALPAGTPAASAPPLAAADATSTPAPQPATASAGPGAPAPAPAPSPTASPAVDPATVVEAVRAEPTAPTGAIESSSAPRLPAGLSDVGRQVGPVLVRVVETPGAGPTTHRVTLQLHPADLGEVRATLTLRDGTVRVTLAGGPAAREMLRQDHPLLQHVLEQTGADRVEISVRALPAGRDAADPFAASAPGDRAGGERSDLSGQPGERREAEPEHRRSAAGRQPPGQAVPLPDLPEPAPAAPTSRPGLDVTV